MCTTSLQQFPIIKRKVIGKHSNPLKHSWINSFVWNFHIKKLGAYPIFVIIIEISKWEKKEPNKQISMKRHKEFILISSLATVSGFSFENIEQQKKYWQHILQVTAWSAAGEKIAFSFVKYAVRFEVERYAASWKLISGVFVWILVRTARHTCNKNISQQNANIW